MRGEVLVYQRQTFCCYEEPLQDVASLPTKKVDGATPLPSRPILIGGEVSVIRLPSQTRGVIFAWP